MTKPKNTGLGRGLDAIFLDNTEESGDNITMLRLSSLEPNPDQPRKEFEPESLAQLADSIATHGLIQPIVVRRSGYSEDMYEIVAGERRWRASKMAGLTEVPVIIMELDDKKAAQIALIENIQRENLNAIEEAGAYQSLMDDHDMTQEDISKQIGKSRSAIANTLRLLELPDYVKGLVKSDKLTAGHARTLLGLKRTDTIEQTASTAVTRGMSVRELEAFVKNLNKEYDRQNLVGMNEPKEGPKVDYMAELSRKMSKRLGRRVTIVNSGKHKRVIVEYNDKYDLEAIIKRLCGDNIFDED